MDIAALSMSLIQVQVAQQASISIMKMGMDTVEVQAVNLAKQLQRFTV